MINFNTLLTQEEISRLSLNKVRLINTLGLYYANLISQNFSLNAEKIVFSMPTLEENDDITKQLLLATIALPDDEEFINILISHGIKYNELYSYSKIISKIKRILSTNNINEINTKTKIIIKILNNLCSIFNNIPENLTLTKIHEIVIFKRNLYHELEKQKTRH